MRVTHVLNRMNFVDGGPPRGVVDLCEAVHSRGHEVNLITTDDVDVPHSWRGRIHVEKIMGPDLPLGFFSRKVLRSSISLIQESEVVHFHGVWERLNHQLASAARRSSVPYVITLRGMLDDWSMSQGGWYKRLFLALYGQRYLDNASRIQCTAQGERIQSSKWFTRTTPVVIPNLMDLSGFQELPDSTEAFDTFGDRLASPALLFLSRIHEKKGIEYLIQSMKLILEKYPSCNLLIAGDGAKGYIEKLKLLADELNVSDHVHWVGHIRGTLKNSLFSASDLFVLPSSQENFGFVLFESMVAGTPVLVSNLVDTAEDIEACGGGVQISQDPQSIASSVFALLSDPSAISRMGTQGREWVLQNLDGQKVALRVEEMYLDAVAPSIST